MSRLEIQLCLFCVCVHRAFEELHRRRSNPLRDFSRREAQMVSLIGQGLSRKECTNELGFSTKTISEYCKSAYRKQGCAIGRRWRPALGR